MTGVPLILNERESLMFDRVVVILFVGFAFAYVNRDTPPFDFPQALFQFIFAFFLVAKLRGRTMGCWQPPERPS
jgi:hypothetical protein